MPHHHPVAAVHPHLRIRPAIQPAVHPAEVASVNQAKQLTRLAVPVAPVEMLFQRHRRPQRHLLTGNQRQLRLLLRGTGRRR